MHVYTATELDPHGVRTHPWLTGRSDQNSRYYDFKRNQELIPQVLEDFLPWAHHEAVQNFYSYIAWLNGPDSELESDDCAFRALEKNLSPDVSKEFQASGRIMLFFRSLELNCEESTSGWLFDCFAFYLKRAEPGFRIATIGLSRATTEFIALNRRHGKSLVLNFWTWGDSETEIMGNFQTLIRGLNQASIEVCTDIRSETNSHGQEKPSSDDDQVH